MLFFCSCSSTTDQFEFAKTSFTRENFTKPIYEDSHMFASDEGDTIKILYVGKKLDEINKADLKPFGLLSVITNDVARQSTTLLNFSDTPQFNLEFIRNYIYVINKIKIEDPKKDDMIPLRIIE